MMSTTLVFAAILVAVSATGCSDSTYGPCNLHLQELPGADVVNALALSGKECFKLVPANEGLFFHLGNNDYDEGVEFKHCDQPGGCTCQSFQPCQYADPNRDSCSCFQPFQCLDTEGFYRCFRAAPCEARAMKAEIQINLNQPLNNTLNAMCETLFIAKFLDSLAECVPKCKFGDVEDVILLDELSLLLPVRTDEDVAAIEQCIDSQYVGIYEYFAFSYGPLGAPSSSSVASSSAASTFAPSSTVLV
jgi:hypothetical protein